MRDSLPWRALIGIALFGTLALRAWADDNEDRLQERFQKAVAIAADADAKYRRAAELMAQAARTQQPAEKTRLEKEIADLAKSAEETSRQARFSMEALASPHRKGYGPAHIWLAERLCRPELGPDGKVAPPTEDAMRECQRHLQFALSDLSSESRAAAHLLLARLLRDAKRPEDSKKQLEMAARERPEFRLILAQIAKNEGATATVVTDAAAAEQAYRSRLLTNQDDIEARLGLIDCLALQSRFTEAKAVLDSGFAMTANVETIRGYAKRLSRLMIDWFDSEEKNPKAETLAQLERLETAFRFDPEAADSFTRVLKMVQEHPDRLEKLRGLSQSNSRLELLINFAIGVDAWQRGQTEPARQAWERALEMSGQAPIIANNLAWLLAFSEPVNLQRALDLANTAVQKSPNEARFRATRGHILVKLERYKEALPDLLEGLKVHSDDAKLFSALSMTYTKLGDDAKAAEYKKRAEELAAKGNSKPNAAQGKSPGT